MRTSYNGWPASADPQAIGVDEAFSVGSVSFPGGVKAGDVATVLGYVAGQIHQHVEELNAGECWGYEYRLNVNDPTTLSCHSSGTAIDLNAPAHPNGVSGTFTPAQVDWIGHILATVHHVVIWGGAWADEMHFEISGSRDQVAAAAAGLGAQIPAQAAPPPIEGNSDVPITSDEMDQIAARVVTALERRLIRSNYAVDDPATGKKVEKARDAHIFETVASANTNSTRTYLGKHG
jgi:hypothetical protein